MENNVGVTLNQEIDVPFRLQFTILCLKKNMVSKVRAC